MNIVRRIFSILGGICLAGVFVVVFAQVVQRYVFQLSMPWANDVIQILFTYSVFLGMAVGIFNRAHLNVDVLVQCFSIKAKRRFLLLTNVIVIVFLSAVFIYSIRFVADNMDQYMTYVKVPMSLSYVAISFSVFFMILHLLLDLARDLKNIASIEDQDLQQKGR